MATYAVPGENLTAIANAIRSKTGSDEPLTVSAMPDAIADIAGGSELTVIPVHSYSYFSYLSDLFDPSSFTISSSQKTMIPAVFHNELFDRIELEDFVGLAFIRTDCRANYIEDYDSSIGVYPRARGSSKAYLTIASKQSSFMATKWSHVYTLPRTPMYFYDKDASSDDLWASATYGMWVTTGVTTAAADTRWNITGHSATNAGYVDRVLNCGCPSIAMRTHATYCSADSYAGIDWNESFVRFDLQVFKAPFEEFIKTPLGVFNDYGHQLYPYPFNIRDRLVSK